MEFEEFVVEYQRLGTRRVESETVVDRLGTSERGILIESAHHDDSLGPFLDFPFF